MSQHVMLGCFLIVLFAGVGAAADIVIDGFKDWQPVAAKYQPNATGQLPSGWNDNSEWAKVNVAYSCEKNADGDYLRLDAKSIEQGHVQLLFSGALPLLRRDQQFKLTFKLRNLTSKPVKIGVRDTGKPYEFHWENEIAADPGWQDCRYLFRPSTPEQPQRLYLRTFAVGRVELAALRLETVNSDAGLLVRTDFVENWQNAATADGLISGSLPAGWSDDSYWCKAKVDYRHEAFQSDQFLRVNVLQLDKGRQQLCLRVLPDAPEGGAVYRLRFKARSKNGLVLQYGLRKSGADYGFFWQKSIRLTEDWQTVEQMISMAHKNSQPMGFWFINISPGVYDVADFSLRLTPIAEMQADIKRRYPDGGPADLCRNSVFPLGLPSGWSLGNDCSDGDAVNIESVAIKGRTLPVIRISSPGQVSLFSAPFQTVVPDLPHLLRLEVKGQGHWKVSLRSAGRMLKQAMVDLNQESWQTIDIPFVSSLLAPNFQVRFDGSGVLELSSMVAGPVGKVEKVEPGRRTEMALALPASDASVAMVQFVDEPARFEYVVIAAPADSVLNGRVTDIYGEMVSLPPIKLSAGMVRGQMNYAITSHQLGAFRVETWIEKDGRKFSPVSELVVNRLKRPRGWGVDLPDSPFGVHTNSTTRHLTIAKAVGFNWVRLHDAGLQYIGWWKLEEEKGKWRFFDQELNRYRTRNLQILGELGTAPSWASYQSKTTRQNQNDYFDKFFQPLDLADYGNYVSIVAGRYKNTIAAWDVWNEPWIHAWWAVDYDRTKVGRSGYVTSKTPGADYARLMETAYRNAKKADPAAIVLGINTTDHDSNGENSFSGDEWTKQVVAAGGLQWCDVFSFHSYVSGPVGYPGDIVSKGIQVAFSPLFRQAATLPKPIWMTEGSGVTNMISNGLYLHTTGESPTDDLSVISDRSCRYMLSLLGNRVSKFFIYSMHSHNGEFQQQPAQWRFLTNDDGSLHPSGAAVSNFAWQIEGLKFDRVIDLKNGICAYLFGEGNRSVAVISSMPQFQPRTWNNLFPGVKASDLYGNPLSSPVTFNGTLIYLYGQIPLDQLVSVICR